LSNYFDHLFTLAVRASNHKTNFQVLHLLDQAKFGHLLISYEHSPCHPFFVPQPEPSNTFTKFAPTTTPHRLRLNGCFFQVNLGQRQGSECNRTQGNAAPPRPILRSRLSTPRGSYMVTRTSKGSCPIVLFPSLYFSTLTTGQPVPSQSFSADSGTGL